jgi:hypothetical protein
MKDHIIPISSVTDDMLAKVEMWSDGKHAYATKEAAAYAIATHVNCSVCGSLTEKFFSQCDRCIDQKRQEEYALLPKKKLSEGYPNAPIYSRADDRIFYRVEDIKEYLHERNLENYENADRTFDDLQLVLCQPVCLGCPEFEFENQDYSEFFEEPQEIHDLNHPIGVAYANLKLAIKNNPVILCYEPSGFALDLEDYHD